MMKKCVHCLLLLVLGGLLTGCLFHVAMAVQIPIQGTASYRAYTARVAVDASGALHIVHTECEISLSDACFVFYRKVSVGGVVETRYWSPPFGGNYTYPDIVVTDGGDAYIAWQYKNSLGEYYDLWTRADSSEAPWFVEMAYESNGAPLLATNGNVVFILYKVVDGTGSAYRYKRLSPGDPVGGWASHHGTNLRPSAEDAAVSPDDKLYVTWAVYNSGSNTIYYNDNHNSAANMGNLRIVVENQSVSGARIDVTKEGSDTFVYMLYHDFEPDAHTTSDDLHLVICANVDCSSWLNHILNLPSAQHWSVGQYELSGVGNRAYVVFTGMKDGLSRMQVFTTGYKTSPAGDVAVQQITTADAHHSSPQLIAFLYAFADYLVLTYQRDMASCDYSLFEYDTYSYQEVPLGEHVFGYQDMALNISGGEAYLGGAWVAPNKLEGDGRWAAYFTYNDTPLYLPLIRR